MHADDGIGAQPQAALIVKLTPTSSTPDRLPSARQGLPGTDQHWDEEWIEPGAICDPHTGKG
jgi:hypothetical protein